MPVDAPNTEGLLTQIRDLLTKSAPAPTDDGGDLRDMAALRQRLSSVTNSRNELRSQIEAIQGQVEQLGKAHVHALDEVKTGAATATTSLAEEHQAKLARLAGAHTEDLKLSDLGIKDDLGRAAVRQAFSAVPEDKRAGDAADYWGGIVQGVAAHKEDKEANPLPDFPRTLLGYVDLGTAARAPEVRTEKKVSTEKPGKPGLVEIGKASSEEELREIENRLWGTGS